MKTETWLWPDHTIRARESRQLREEHNELVNSHADLLAACKAAESTITTERNNEGMTVEGYGWLRLVRAALAKAESGAK